MLLTAFKKKAEEMGWSHPPNPQQITLFDIIPPGSTSTVQINVIEQYARISILDLTTQCACFITGVDKEKRANQNNFMMQKCLHDSLLRECQLKLVQYEKETHINGKVCAPLLFKVLMRTVTMDSVTKIKSLKTALNALEVCAAEVKGDVPQILAKFVELRNRLRAAGVEVDGLQDTLFTALKASPVEKFASYIKSKEDSHDDGTKPISPDELIIVAQKKLTS